MVDRRRTAINADAVAEWRDVIAAGVTRPYVTPAELTELLNCWEARAQADSAPLDVERLRELRDAVELMDTKVTPYGTRDDSTIAFYIVADSTWHRVVAVARGSTSEAARTAIAGYRTRTVNGRAEAKAAAEGIPAASVGLYIRAFVDGYNDAWDLDPKLIGAAAPPEGTP